MSGRRIEETRAGRNERTRIACTSSGQPARGAFHVAVYANRPDSRLADASAARLGKPSATENVRTFSRSAADISRGGTSARARDAKTPGMPRRDARHLCRIVDRRTERERVGKARHGLAGRTDRDIVLRAAAAAAQPRHDAINGPGRRVRPLGRELVAKGVDERGHDASM